MPDKFKLNRERLKSIALEIRNMENECDSSMRGVYLGELVNSYAETFGNDFAKMFCYIYDNQKEDKDSYGDYDSYIVKLKINGIPYDEIQNKKYDIVTRGILLKNIFCDVNFIITEVTRTHQQHDISSIKYYAYEYECKEDEEIESIDVKKYTKFNYETGVVVFKKEKHFNESFVLDTNDSPKVFYHYNKFKLLIDSLREPYYELMENAGEDVSKI